MTATVLISRTTPKTVDAVGVPVATSGSVPRSLGLNRAALAAAGFEGKPARPSSCRRPPAPRRSPSASATPARSPCRACATPRPRWFAPQASVGSSPPSLADLDGVDAAKAAQAVVEGALLAGYRYAGIKKTPNTGNLTELVLVVGEKRTAGARPAATAARSRPPPPAGTRPGQHAPGLHDRPPHGREGRGGGRESGLTVEVFNRDQLAAMGCGGMLGVNAGSVEPPRMVRLTYTPRNPSGHLALVGKGVMFDSGGLSLKPSDGMLAMKMDMSGAAAVLATMGTLEGTEVQGEGHRLPDVHRQHVGRQRVQAGRRAHVPQRQDREIHNTDAEGRLVLADGLSLAVEDGPDAIVDIATLTGACMVALGTKIAGVIGNDQPFVDKVRAARHATDEQMWQLPLEKAYRKQLDSNVADMRNIGGPPGGAITAALFLNEFVADVPWAHLDIAGPMAVDGDDGWLSKGATGFGTRLLIELATTFAK
jgi:leucyl aminopeptidase